VPKWDVPLYEGSNITTFRVEAETEDEALEKATAFRDSHDRFSQLHSRESLEAEHREIMKQQVQADTAQALAPAVGVGQAFTDIGAGAADAILNMAEGIAVLGGGTHFGESAVEGIRNTRANIKEKAIDLNSGAQEFMVGRPLSEDEKIQTAVDTQKFIKRGKFATDMTVGVAGGAATLAAKTLPRMLALGAAEGGLGGWLMADSEDTQGIREQVEKRALEASIGSVLGTGLSVVPGLFAAGKNWVGRRILRAGGGREAIQQTRQELGRLGIHRATPGQVTGDPDLIRAEQEAAAGLAQKMLREQATGATSGLGRTIGIEIPSIAKLLKGGREAVRNVMELSEKAFGKMKGRRNKSFQKAMEKLDEMTGSKPVIRTDRFAEEFNAAIKKIGEDWGEHIPIAGGLKSIAKMVKEAEGQGGLTAKQANVVLMRLRAMQNSGRGIFDTTSPEVAANLNTFTGNSKIIAKQLKDSLEASFDDTVSSLGGAAGKTLQKARQAYGEQTGKIIKLEDDFRSSVGINGTPGDILEKLRTADPATARQFVKSLRKMEGGQEVIDTLNTHMFRSAVNDASAARVGQGHRLGDFDLSTFVQSLMQNTKASRLQGLLTKQQEKALAQGVNSIRKLLNTTDNIQRTHLPFELQNIAINAVSRDPGFMSRMIAIGIQKGQGAEALFYTKAGQDILFDAVNHAVRAQKSGATTQAVNAIIANFLSMVGAKQQMKAAYDLVGEGEQNLESQEQ
jgi:hypothetical protein